MFCMNCGNPLFENAVCCAYCGAPAPAASSGGPAPAEKAAWGAASSYPAPELAENVSYEPFPAAQPTPGDAWHAREAAEAPAEWLTEGSLFCVNCGGALCIGDSACAACGAPVYKPAIPFPAPYYPFQAPGADHGQSIFAKLKTGMGILWDDGGMPALTWRKLIKQPFDWKRPLGAVAAADGISGEMPAPWLFRQLFVLSFLLFAAFYLAAALSSGNLAISVYHMGDFGLLAALLATSALAAPLSLLTLARELHGPRNARRLDLFLMFAAGAAISVPCSFVSALFETKLRHGLGMIIFYIVMAAVVEAAKLSAIKRFAASLKAGGILGHMLIGAAIGAGFSVFDAAGQCCLSAFAGYGSLGAMLWQSLVFPLGGHAAWGAIMGAAAASKDRAEGFSPLPSFRFLAAAPVALDSFVSISKHFLQSSNIAALWLALALFAVASLVLFIKLANIGLRESASLAAESADSGAGAPAWLN
jgi:hypothetical protein